MGLVRSVARRYARGGEPVDDLVQVGAIGLIKAVDRFEPARGSDLRAVAVPAIEGEIRHHLRDRSAPVRVPRRLQAAGVRVSSVTLEQAGHVADSRVDPQERMVLDAALRSLHTRERELLRLRFAEDLSQAQIAARTGLSQTHVSRTLRGALQQLREVLVAGTNAVT